VIENIFNNSQLVTEMATRVYVCNITKQETKRATLLLACATAISQITPQRTGRKIEHGTPPQIEPKYQNLDTHGNNYYFLLIF
jgi:hypothetical protein